jgi:clan AA aspartic protease
VNGLVLKQNRTNKVVSIDGYISNPKHPKLRTQTKFVVDTGASGCVVSKKLAKQLKLEEVGRAEAELADGRVVDFPFAYVCITICEKPVIALVAVIDSDSASTLLGFDVMEILELQIDVKNRKLLKPIKWLKIGKLTMLKPWPRAKAKKQ